MDYLGHPEFIEEWKQNIDAAAYEKNINQDVKKLIIIINLTNFQQA